MSSWNLLVRQLAVSVNAITGATAATLETSYSTVPLTSANFQSSILPFTNIKDHCINGVSKIVSIAANDGNHPYRAALISQTDPLGYGDEVTVDSSGVPIIGVWGAIRDDDTGEVLTRGNLAQIRARVTNPNDLFLVDVYWWARDDVRIYHTVDNVVIDVVAFDRPDADSLVLTTEMPLPDDAVSACVQAAQEECIRDDEFMAQGARFGDMFTKWVEMVQSRSVDSTTKPVEKAA
jgi:hypothetical protein